MIRVFDTSKDKRETILYRDTAASAGVDAAVEEILEQVRREGDKALFALEEKFDKARLTGLEVAPEEIDEAWGTVGEEFLATLQTCGENIRAFHSKQIRQGFVTEEADGVLLGQRITPIERVGVYVPGGRASYPSTVLMNVIPAKLAGVTEICMATPPGPDGKISAPILAAARVAGVDRIFKMGGAQAVAAFAYGTETVPAVDKIVGPGNIYVATAKARVFGRVSIDMVAGPSEILIISDGKSNPAFVAADLLSQAEHDPMSMSVLLTDSAPFAQAVSAELERQIPLLPKAEICRMAIDRNGKIVVTRSLREAVDLSNDIAPEHLELCVEDPFGLLGRVKNAGSIFLGRYAPEALGDYYAGPNHTLPTSGTARFSSPLSVDDFIKKSSFVYYTEERLRKAMPDIVRFGEAEGLAAHAKSVAIRFEQEEGER